MSKVFRNVLIGGAALAGAAGAAVWAVAPRGFKNKQKHYVPTVPNVWYAHRGLHDAGSGLTADYAEQSGEYVALARRMAVKAGYGSETKPGPIAPENSMAAFAAACEAGYGIELDIQLSRDGEVVVVHDADLGRVAGDPRNIKDLSYSELTRIPLYPTAEPGDARAGRRGEPSAGGHAVTSTGRLLPACATVLGRTETGRRARAADCGIQVRKQRHMG